MEANTPPGQAEGTTDASLDSLPNEVLLMIFSYFDLHPEERILGFTPDNPMLNPMEDPNWHLIKDFRTCSVRNLALTCKRFAQLTREMLLYAPVIELVPIEQFLEDETRGAVGFVRTLDSNPNDCRFVKQLRLSWTDIPSRSRSWFRSMYRSTSSPRGLLPLDTKMSQLKTTLHLPRLNRTFPALRSYPLPTPRPGGVTPSVTDSLAITHSFADSCLAILLALLPRLEILCLSDPYVMIPSWFWPDRLAIGDGPALSYLKIERPRLLVPLVLFESEQLQTLDLSLTIKLTLRDTIEQETQTLKFESIRLTGGRPIAEIFQHIRHLRLDFQVKTLGRWSKVVRTYMNAVLGRFKNLQSLTYYAESSAWKNPYRGCRCFPAHQADIEHYPSSPPSSENELARGTDEPDWSITSVLIHRDFVADNEIDVDLYDARTEATDYQYQVLIISHLCPDLQLLQLPGGFWTLPGGVQKTPPRFTKFSKLKKLIIPQAALISIYLKSMLPDPHSNGHYKLSAAQVLPPCLEELTVFDADASFLSSTWLKGFFKEQKEGKTWNAFQKLKILFGATFSDKDLTKLLERRGGKAFWDMVEEAQFSVEVERDNIGCWG